MCVWVLFAANAAITRPAEHFPIIGRQFEFLELLVHCSLAVIQHMLKMCLYLELILFHNVIRLVLSILQLLLIVIHVLLELLDI